MRTEGSSKRVDSLKSIEKESVVIRTKIDGEVAKQFLEIQKRSNLVTYAETLRHLISQVYNSTNLRLHPELINEINHTIQNKSIIKKYAFIDVEDFINRSIAFYLQKMKDEKATLDNWEVRSKLPEEFRQVALALIKKQVEQGQIGGVLLEELINESKLPQERVEKIITYFLNQDLVVATSFNDEIYYTAILTSS